MSVSGGHTWINDKVLRQTAFSVEQMAPGGTERPNPGLIGQEDLDRALSRLDSLLNRPSGQQGSRRAALQNIQQRTNLLADSFVRGGKKPLVYLGKREFSLEPRLRSAAIEIDFCFGDKDGNLSPKDINQARHHYAQVRGPVGWNRLLLTDEVEKRIFPNRTLHSAEGMKLQPNDWIENQDDPLGRLTKVARYLDDDALARTYADIAARFATVASPDADPRLSKLCADALTLLGKEIQNRDSVRPTITDIARIGCEDPAVRAWLRSPIEMSRRLKPAILIEQFLQ